MRLGCGFAWGLGGGLEICVDSEFADPTGSSSGNVKVVMAATSGGGPEFGMMFVVCDGCLGSEG
jgi:hypothetical protein